MRLAIHNRRVQGYSTASRLLLAALVLAPAVHCPGQLPAARLSAVFPPGAKSGSTVELTVSGQELDNAKELLFSHAGITATAAGTNKFKVEMLRDVPVGTYDVRVVGRNGISNPRAFAVGTMAETNLEKGATSRDTPIDVPLNSTVNARAETNSIQYFRVSVAKNDRVLARCEARALDSRLEPVLAVLDESGRELDRNRRGGLLDFTAPGDGRFIIKVHDTIFRGGTDYWYRLSIGTFPHVDFVFPPVVAPGRNKVTVFGRNLARGTPRREVTVDGKPLEQVEVEIDVPSDPSARGASLAGVPFAPAQASADLFAYRFASNQRTANPVLLSIAASPVLAEQGAAPRLGSTGHWPVPSGDSPDGTAVKPARKNDIASSTNAFPIPVGGSPTGTGGSPVPPAAQLQKISLPCEVAGQFRGRADRDSFTFAAKKGETYWIEVVSHRLGLPTDPLVVIQRVSGESVTDVLELNDSETNVGGADFNPSHRDPAGRFEVKEDGTYRLQIRDLFAPIRPDPRRVYHLSIRKPAPDFHLVALPQPQPQKKDAKDVPLVPLALHRGETMPLKVLALRRDGFDGDIAVAPVDLPPGVSAAPCRIDGGRSSALLFLTAAEDVAASNTVIAIRGAASIAGVEVSRVAAPATIVWGTADPANEAPVSRLAANTALSLGEQQVALRVHAASNVIEAVTGKTVKVNFLIDRGESSTGGVKLKPFGMAALDSLAELDVDAKATNLVLQIDLREKKVPVGMHVFALQVSPQAKAAAEGKKPKDPPPAFYSEPVVLHVNPALVATTNAPAK